MSAPTAGSTPTAGGTAAATAAAVATALALEYQAVFGYEALGPRLSSADQVQARADSAAHDRTTANTVTTINAAGGTAAPAQADYPGIVPVPDAAAARRLAVRLEQDCAAAWRAVYLQAASAADADTRVGRARRAGAQTELTSCAIRAARWRRLVTPSAATTPFPGL